MNKIVVKFGGSILKTPEDFKKLSTVVKSYPVKLVIVVSALYGVTDRLSEFLSGKIVRKDAVSTLTRYLKKLHFDFIDFNIRDNKTSERIKGEITGLIKTLTEYLTGLRLIKDIPGFSRAFVLSFGERLSAKLISSLLFNSGIKTEEVLPEEIGLYSNLGGEFSGVDFERSSPNVKNSLEKDINFVIPGFYGIDKGSRVAVFGRGGSDYTAAAIANCIGAEFLDLWKDVRGFMTSDPKIVKDAVSIGHLSYEEAAELSYFGAKIIHPGTFIPVRGKKIKVRIFFSENFSEGLRPVTEIDFKRIVEKKIVKSISFSNDIAILRIGGADVGGKPGIIASVSEKLSDAGINIKSIITSQTTINFLLSEKDIDKSLEIVKVSDTPEIERITKINNISILAAVGEGLENKYGIAAKILSALKRKKINVRLLSLGASETSMYVIVNRSECEIALRSIHKEFFGEEE